MGMKLGEFFVSLGLDMPEAALLSVKDLSEKLEDMPAAAAGAVLALAGVNLSLIFISRSAMEAAVAFQAFTSQTGLSSGELRRWQVVAEQANVSAEVVAGTIQAIQRNMAEISLGRGNVAPFQLLGVDPRGKDAFQTLQKLLEQARKLPRPVAVDILQQAGVGPEMARFLDMTAEEFAVYSKTVTGMTADQEKTFLSAKLALVQLGLVFRQIGYQVISFLGPAFTKFVDIMRNLLEHFVNAAAHVWDFHATLKAIGTMAAIILSPVLLLGAAFAALVLAFDDLAVYFTGGKSMFGEGIGGLKKLIAALKEELTPDFIKSLNVMGEALNSLSQLGNLLMLGGLPQQAGMAAAGAATVIQNNTINVHSTGSPEDVGRSVAGELTRQAGAAAQQLNNQDKR